MVRHRRNTVGIVNDAGNFVPGAGYTITAYPVGAQVDAASSGTSVSVRPNHNFAAGDRVLVKTVADGLISLDSWRNVESVSGDTLTLDSSISLSVGDILINLSGDTGATEPNYDNSAITIYEDMGGESSITNSRVTCDSYGNYSYWTEEQVWELVRDSDGSPVDVIVDAVPMVEDEHEFYVSNYSSIQAAINAASTAGGGVVYGDPNATYTENITIKSDVMVDLNWATLKPETDAATVAFDTSTNCVRAGLRRFIIDGSDNKATFTSNDGIQMHPGATYFHDLIIIEDGRVQHCGRYGMSLQGESSSQFVQGASVRRVKFTSNANEGIRLTGFVIESHFESCGANLNSTSDTTEESVTLNTDGGNPQRTKFTNCWFNNTAQTSGALVHNNGSTETHFDTCLFENAVSYVLSDSSVNKNLKFTNCLFSTDNSLGSPEYAIKLQRQNGFSWSNCRVTLAATACIELAATGAGQLDNLKLYHESNVINGPTSFLVEGSNPEAKLFRAFTASDATPDVSGWVFWKTNNSGATTITGFDNGVPGQRLFVQINDTFTALDFSGTTLKGNAATTWSPTTGDAAELFFDGTNWYAILIDGTA